MSQQTPLMPPVRPSVPREDVPRLQNGDRLDRIEFERRYRATPDIRKAELIEGRVYVAPPISQLDHSGPHSKLNGLLMLYAVSTPGVDSGIEGSIRMDLDNMPQPDNFLYVQWGPTRTAKLDDDGYLSGAPEFIAEVAASSANYDLHEKLNAYRRNGVREYLVWRTYDNALDYFILTDGHYERLAQTDGMYRSRVFPGLWFDIATTLRRDGPAMVRTLQLGLASPEHQVFVEHLAQHKPA
jgi:hypothetical protein